jgi:LysM repeat protein
MVKRSSIFAIVIFLMSVMTVVAQVTSCPALVEQALVAVGNNCADMDRNSACYGYNELDATFSQAFPDDYFVAPSDRTSLVYLDTLATQPLDLENDRWGVAVLNIQANLPNTLPGQGVIMMLVGDAEIRNDVPAEEANTIGEPLSTATLQDTNVHASPSLTSDFITTIPTNEIVLVDGFNTPQTWLRMVNNGTIGWIQSETVARLAAMDNLPTIGANHPTPMQAFYLSTGIGQSQCSEADSMIAVQSPEDITVDLTVNGVDIRVGSLVTFQNLDDNILSLVVHRGSARTVFGNIIEAGQSAFAVIQQNPDGSETIIIWGDPVPASQNDLALGKTAQMGINQVAKNNGWPERSVDESTSESSTTTPQSTSESGELIHIVVSGETLFSIGRLYDASLPAIVARNGLSDPYILFVGQELVIPNPGSGFVGLPSSASSTPQTPSSTDTSSGTCGELQLIAPLGPVPTEPVPYYWSGVSGATQYQVNIYDQATGMLMGTRYTNGAETSVTISAGELSVGGGLQWEVIALQNGQVLCGTGLSQPLIHSAPVQPDVVEEKGDFFIFWECDGSDIKVSWRYAYSDDVIDIVIKDDYGGKYKRTGTGASGSVRATSSGYNFVEASAETLSGESDSVTGDKYCN